MGSFFVTFPKFIVFGCNRVTQINFVNKKFQ